MAASTAGVRVYTGVTATPSRIRLACGAIAATMVRLSGAIASLNQGVVEAVVLGPAHHLDVVFEHRPGRQRDRRSAYAW